MKKTLLFLFGALMSLTALARDFEYTYEGQTLTYTVLDEDARTCTTKDGYYPNPGNTVTGDLVIPAVVSDGTNNYSVTAIGHTAFFGCKELTSVILPDGVTTIEVQAFYGCAGMASITLPETLTEIGVYAFGLCENLRSIEIPQSVTTIGNAAFYYCTSLLGSVSLPESLSSIADFTFEGCSHLSSVTIPDNVNSIGKQAFRECRSLSSVIIPDNVSSIERMAFDGCKNMRSITLPSSLTNIADYAFSGCQSLKSVEIPHTVKNIGASAFYYCKGLTSVTIPNAVTTIGEQAFRYCTALRDLTLGGAIQSIGAYAFENCVKLRTVVIPSSVTEIGEAAFRGCDDLWCILIGSGLKSLGAYAFEGCVAGSYYITAEFPPAAYDNSFSDNSYSKAYLFVNNYSVRDDYRNAESCWSKFSNYGVLDPATGLDRGESSPLIFMPGKTQQLYAKVVPANATLPFVFWHSTNPDVATVDANGLVTFHEPKETGEIEDENPAAVRAVNDSAPCKIIASTLYPDCPVLEFTIQQTEVDDIVNDATKGGDIDFSKPVEVYNLSGSFVAGSTGNLVPGIYIVRQGNAVRKIAVR